MRVGVVSWNTADLLDRCLTALPEALDGLPAEVVVVDNASSDDSVAVARRHGVDVVTNHANRGYAVAMNQALAGTHAPVLLALNPDTEPAPGTLRRLVEALEEHPSAGVVVPRLVDAGARPQPSAHRFPDVRTSMVAALATRRVRGSRLGRRMLLDGSGPHQGGTVDWAIGAVHVIRAAALGGEAPYSERSFMYAEDLDLCWRLAQRGWPTVLVDDVTVTHVGNAAGGLAWGDARSPRFWAATYDVIAQRRGAVAARWVGAGCTAACLVSMARTAAAVTMGRDRAAGRRLLGVRGQELRVHARTVIRGAPAPPTSPPEAEVASRAR